MTLAPAARDNRNPPLSLPNTLTSQSLRDSQRYRDDLILQSGPREAAAANWVSSSWSLRSASNIIQKVYQRGRYSHCPGRQ